MILTLRTFFLVTLLSLLVLVVVVVLLGQNPESNHHA
jgi:hypothetical protein